MDDTFQATRTRAASIRLKDKPRPDQLVGMYAVHNDTGLNAGNAGVPYETVRIEKVCGGHQQFMYVRRVWIDDAGNIERQDNHLRIPARNPLGYVADPAEAKRRCDAANAIYREIGANIVPDSMTFREWRAWQDARIKCVLEDGETTPRFAKTFCSNCGREFGPGDHGYSHCENHGGRGPGWVDLGDTEPPAERYSRETPPGDIWHRIYEAKEREAINVA